MAETWALAKVAVGVTLPLASFDGTNASGGEMEREGGGRTTRVRESV